MVIMKNTGFWEVTLLFLRNTHQYVVNFYHTTWCHTLKNGILHLPSDIFQHESHFTATNASISGYTTLADQKTWASTIQLTFNTLTNVKTEARDVQSPAYNSNGNTCLVLHVQATVASVLN